MIIQTVIGVQAAGTVNNHMLHQTLRQRGAGNTLTGSSAAGAAEDGHIFRIAAEEADILLHPAECQNLILQSVVTG